MADCTLTFHTNSSYSNLNVAPNTYWPTRVSCSATSNFSFKCRHQQTLHRCGTLLHERAYRCFVADSVLRASYNVVTPQSGKSSHHRSALQKTLPHKKLVGKTYHIFFTAACLTIFWAAYKFKVSRFKVALPFVLVLSLDPTVCELFQTTC